MADVKAALTKAAGTPYWSTVRNKPEGYSGDGSEITVPVNLMKAVAWQESGWQSTIIACDGGIGTMQGDARHGDLDEPAVRHLARRPHAGR